MARAGSNVEPAGAGAEAVGDRDVGPSGLDRGTIADLIVDAELGLEQHTRAEDQTEAFSPSTLHLHRVAAMGGRLRRKERGRA